MAETILITGANRGIGFALARNFTEMGWQVLACCRHPDTADDLRELAGQTDRVRLLALDVTDLARIDRLKKELEGEPISILFNNAGLQIPKDRQKFGALPVDEWLEVFRVNTIAPVKLAEALIDNVASSNRRVIANMGSIMGSIAENESGGFYPYRSAKCALHMVTKGLSVDLQAWGIIAVVLHPGWVQTRMGGPEAAITPEESVAGLTKVLLNLYPEDSGKFFDFTGTERPW